MPRRQEVLFEKFVYKESVLLLDLEIHQVSSLFNPLRLYVLA
jgi:hypothetical protein